MTENEKKETQENVKEEKKTYALTLPEIKEASKMLMVTNFRPDHFKKPEDAIMAGLHGQDLGLPLTVAWKHIYVVNGQPSLTAKAKLALVKRSNPNFKMHIVERSNKRAAVKVWQDRVYADEWTLFEWTLEDAENAELLNNPKKPLWKKYRRNMLFARCISDMADAIDPGATGGFYTPEETQFFDAPKPLTKKQLKYAEEFVIDAEYEEIKPEPKMTKAETMELQKYIMGLNTANKKFNIFGTFPYDELRERFKRIDADRDDFALNIDGEMKFHEYVLRIQNGETPGSTPESVVNAITVPVKTKLDPLLTRDLTKEIAEKKKTNGNGKIPKTERDIAYRKAQQFGTKMGVMEFQKTFYGPKAQLNWEKFSNNFESLQQIGGSAKTIKMDFDVSVKEELEALNQ